MRLTVLWNKNRVSHLSVAPSIGAALTGSGHAGEVYEVTGPRLMTFAEAVEEIAQAVGRELRYQQIPADEFVRGMRELQVPEQVVSLTRYLFETVLDGRNASIADGVERALGRPPRDFAEFARDASETAKALAEGGKVFVYRMGEGTDADAPILFDKKS